MLSDVRLVVTFEGEGNQGNMQGFSQRWLHVCFQFVGGKKIIILDLGKLLYDIILQYKVTTKLLPIKGNSHCGSEAVYKMAVTYLSGLLSTFVVVILGGSLSLKGPGILCETL